MTTETRETVGNLVFEKDQEVQMQICYAYTFSLARFYGNFIEYTRLSIQEEMFIY